jgi:hypothetical protein
MKKKITSILVFCLLINTAYSQVFSLNWQRFTDGTAHMNDSIVAIKAEGAGVIVGGNIYNAGTLGDILIQSYDLSGNLLWSGAYASPLNDHLANFQCNEDINAMYAAGNSDNGSYLVGLLIKMDMNGKLLWSQTSGGTFPGNTSFADLKIAPNGNIIVVGKRVLSQILSDALIEAYDAQGKLLWSKTAGAKSGESRFNHLQIDEAGNIFTSGYFFNGIDQDGYVAKYDANGTLLNSITIKDADNKDDEVKSLGLMNNVLYAVTGNHRSGYADETIITAYNSADCAGIWETDWQSYTGTLLLCDSLNINIVVLGLQRNPANGTSDYLALSYNASTGTQNWARTISGGTGYNNIATAMEIDATASLLITGQTNLPGMPTDYFTVEFDASGKLIDTQVFDGTASGDDIPYAICADKSGNIFVAGFSFNKQAALNNASTTTGSKGNKSKPTNDFTVLKYSRIINCSIPTGLFSSDITNLSAIVHWDVMPAAIAYKVQYRSVGGTWISISTVTNYTKLAELSSNTKYQWKVNSICSSKPDSSIFSSVQDFRTLAARTLSRGVINKDVATVTKQSQLQLFPTPATKTVTLQLLNNSDANLSVSVYDLSGRELKRYQFQSNAKIFNRQLDITALAPGSYIVVLTGSKLQWPQLLIKK